MRGEYLIELTDEFGTRSWWRESLCGDTMDISKACRYQWHEALAIVSHFGYMDLVQMVPAPDRLAPMTTGGPWG